MKLAITNLAWEEKYDDVMYYFLREHDIALEVAPSRIFRWEESKVSGRMVSPYERSEEAENWYRIVHTHYKINIASMQSLLYNIQENLFANATYRRFLKEYLHSAVRFADRIKCPNLCFGCAANRKIPEGMDLSRAGKIAVAFLGELADYAWERGIVLSIEPLPESAGTNFINYTEQAFELARTIGKPGLKVSVDLGTIIENKEKIQTIFTTEHLPLINHIHISEPRLAPIKKRKLYTQTAELLRTIGYEGYVSVEMMQFPEVKLLQGVLNYFHGVFLK